MDAILLNKKTEWYMILLIVNRMDYCLDAILLFSNHEITKNRISAKCMPNQAFRLPLIQYWQLSTVKSHYREQSYKCDVCIAK